jgi:hypothetical protein
MEQNEHGISAIFKDRAERDKSNQIYTASIGKEISDLKLADETLRIVFTDGTAINVYDSGMECSEHRYMTTDDDLDTFVRAKFMGADLLFAPTRLSDYGIHEIAFLHIKTNIGTFVLETHNEHNGYYGGFYVVFREDE